jgi:hypothetical protein
MVFRFIFTLGPRQLSDDDVERLYEGGCDDASCYCTSGVWHVAFDREADHLEHAIRSAKQQVQSCGFEVQHIEVETSQEALP